MAPVHQRFGAGKAALRIVKSAEDTPRPQPKVLRIGLVESGRIVDEKIVEKGRDVSIGSSEKNDFVITVDALPVRYALFEHHGDGYSLYFTDDMDGRVSYPGGFSELSVLRCSGRVKRSGRRWRLDLSDDARGKVKIGESTLLFQMVTAPLVQPTPQLPSAVRSGWLRSIDWFFSSLIVASFMAQFGLVIWLVQRDWPLQPAFIVTNEWDRRLFDTRPSQVDIDRLNKLNKRTPIPEDAQALAPPVPVENPATGQPTPKVFRTLTPRTRGKGPETRAALDAAARDRVQKALGEQTRELLGRINLIGSRNQDGEGAVADVLRGGGVEVDQDTVMAQISGLRVASADGESVLRRPTSGNSEDVVADVGSLRRRLAGNAGNVESGSMGGETAPTARIKRGRPISVASSRGTLDAGAVRRVVGQSLGGIKACYERSLRRNRSLQGRVTINFTIGEGGRVTRAQATGSTLGAPEVGQCIATRFRSLRFPSPTGGPVTFQYPFIFEPSR